MQVVKIRDYSFPKSCAALSKTSPGDHLLVSKVGLMSAFSQGCRGYKGDNTEKQAMRALWNELRKHSFLSLSIQVQTWVMSNIYTDKKPHQVLVSAQGTQLKTSTQNVPERRTHFHSFQPTAKITAHENRLDCPNSFSSFSFLNSSSLGPGRLATWKKKKSQLI